MLTALLQRRTEGRRLLPGSNTFHIQIDDCTYLCTPHTHFHTYMHIHMYTHIGMYIKYICSLPHSLHSLIYLYLCTLSPVPPPPALIDAKEQLLQVSQNSPMSASKRGVSHSRPTSRALSSASEHVETREVNAHSSSSDYPNVATASTAALGKVNIDMYFH